MAVITSLLNGIPVDIVLSNEDRFKSLADTPKPVRCKFCGKELPFEGIYWKDTHKIEWSKKPMNCDCIGFQKEASRIRLEKIKAFELREKLACIKRIKNDSGLCKREFDRSFSNFIENDANHDAKEKAYQYASNFTKKIMNFNKPQTPTEKFSLYIYGNVGLGKTHLASAVANYLINEEVKVVFTSISDLLQKIRQTFNSSDSDYIFESEVTEKYISCDLLIIDDFGKDKSTDWSVSKVFEIINKRYENYNPMIITSNYSLGNLEKRLTPSNTFDCISAQAVVDRLYEMCYEICLSGDSFRKKPIQTQSISNRVGGGYGY